MQFLLNRHNSGVGSPRFLGYGGCMRKPLSGRGDHAAFLNLLRAIAAAEQQHGIRELDFLSREILHKIAAANIKKQSVRVSSIGEGNGFGTMPTVLARLARLVDGGWIEKVDDPEDARAVLLEITPKTKSIFRKISNVSATPTPF